MLLFSSIFVYSICTQYYISLQRLMFLPTVSYITTVICIHLQRIIFCTYISSQDVIHLHLPLHLYLDLPLPITSPSVKPIGRQQRSNTSSSHSTINIKQISLSLSSTSSNTTLLPISKTLSRLIPSSKL